MASIKDSQSYHFSAQAPKRDIGLPMAIVIAVSVHALVIFGISFSMGQDPAGLYANFTQRCQNHDNQ